MTAWTSRRFLLAAAATGALLSAGAEARRQDAPIRPAAETALRGNAALLYWRAFSMFNDDMEKAIAEAAPQSSERVFRLSLDQQGALRHSGEVVDHLLRASSIDRCDFAIDYERWPHTLLPHLGAMRTGARLLAIDARLRLNEGDTDAAVDRVAAMIRMSSHTAQDTTLISSLVSVAMFAAADGVMQAALPPEGLTPAQRGRIADALAEFPGEDPFRTRAGVAMEARLTTAWVRSQIGDARSRDELASLFGGPGSERAIKAIRSGEPLDAQVDLLAAGYTQVLAAWESQEPVAGLEAVGAQISDGAFGDLAAGLLPSLSNARKSDAAMQLRLRDAIERHR